MIPQSDAAHNEGVLVMRKILFLFSLMLGWLFPVWAQDSASAAIPYVMDSSFFSIEIPADWSMERNKEEDEKYRIYEIELFAPAGDTASVKVYVSYYAEDNDDFNGYADFIKRNAANALGETKNSRETYEPVKRTILAGREGFILERERMVFISPESKSDASIDLKEIQYVLPAKDGFYVLHYSASKTSFLKFLSAFERLSDTFKGRF
jgi:hypothetical protein